MAQQPSVHQLYKRLQTVGKGSYGSVHKGIEIATGNVVALKIINLDDDEVDSIQHEVALLSQLRDAPNITKYFGSYLDGPRLWIVMEFAQGGSVYQLMKSSPGNVLEERFVVILVREVLIGLNYLHKSGVIHRDIKSANVLVTATGKVMICDFGVSALLATNASKRNTFIGTLNWMAPEVVQAVPNYDTKADIWSLGIMIYEMVKGSPPHSNVSQERVLQLIPRVKPPRLIESEGSKDLRDFIPLCLTEKPGDRLPAEELLKTKWIKAVSKVPVTILKDLLLRYETWVKTSGDADDLSEPLPWEKDEENDLQFGDNDDNPWEFDTVRGRSFGGSASLAALDASEDTEGASFPTVRPAPSKLPSSLRLLFDSDPAAVPDPFRIPGFGGGVPKSNGDSASSSPTPPFLLPSSVSPSPSRDRNNSRRAIGHDPDEPNLSNATFSFPARAPSRAKSRLGTSSEGENPLPTLASSQGDQPASPSVSRDSSPPGTSFANDLNPLTDSRSGPSYRAIRSTRGVPDLEILPPPSPASSDLSTGSAASVPEAISIASGILASTTRRPAMRNRSQSSATSALSGRGDRNFAFPPDFQFPAPASTVPDSAGSNGPSSSRTIRAHDRTSPTHASASNASISSISGHNPTHSLEVPLSARRIPPSGSSVAPLAIGRSRSATPYSEGRQQEMAVPASASTTTALLRKPSLNRLASVAVMETTQPPVNSLKPGLRSGRGRSGSSTSSGNDLVGVPGLKDVLKVPSLSSEHQLGMTDLLPPSPSVSATNIRPYVPTPSHFALEHQAEPAPTSTTGSSMSLDPPSSGLQPALSGPSLHSRSNSLATPSPLSRDRIPEIRPLDFGAVIASHEETHAELGRIVEDLAQWLSITEAGLIKLLESAGEDRIEEEQEEVGGYEEDTEMDRGLRVLALAAS